MDNGTYLISRATLDELAQLTALAKSLDIEVAFVERHLTDFQLAKSHDGKLLGAIALEIVGLHARLHSEMFVDFGISDPLRAELWTRIQSIAKSRGLTRLWTQESSLFWKHQGFEPIGKVMDLLPQNWSALESPEKWLTIQLRDEEALKTALEKEFTRLKQEDEITNGDSLRGVYLFKNFAIFLSALVVVIGIAFCIYILRNLPVISRFFHK